MAAVFSKERLKAAVASRRLSADAIRSIAYVIADAIQCRSDVGATVIGKRLTRGEITEQEADMVVVNCRRLTMDAWDQIAETE